MDDRSSSPTAILGAAVRAQRRRLGLAQEVLADLAGVGVAFLYDLERGKPTLRIDKVLAVLEALGLGLTVAASATRITVDPGLRGDAGDGGGDDRPAGDGSAGGRSAGDGGGRR